MGLEPDRRALDARRARGLPVGRPHLAEVVLADHRERLEREGLTSPSAFIAAYLTPGGAGYSCRSAPLVRDAIAAIHDAGGVAVWAHPFWDLTRAEDVASTLVRFVSDGLDGVEAFYITHDRTQTRFLSDLAGEMGLLTTGSADFHCPRHTLFSRFRAFDLFGCTPELGRSRRGHDTACRAGCQSRRSSLAGMSLVSSPLARLTAAMRGLAVV